MYLNLEIERAPEYLKKALEENRRKFAELEDRTGKGSKEDRLRDAEQMRELINKDRQDYIDIQLSYINYFSTNPLSVLDDVKEILAAIEKKDFVKWFNNKQSIAEDYENNDNPSPDKIAAFKKINNLSKDYHGATMFLKELLSLQCEVLIRFNNDNLSILPEMIKSKAAEWYKVPQQNINIMSMSDVPSLVISHKNYKSALTNKLNDAAYITYAGDDQIKMGFDEDGNAYIALTPKKYTPEELLKKGYNEGLFGVILGATLKSFLTFDSRKESITVNVGEFAKAIEADYRAKNPTGKTSKHKGMDFIKLLENNENFFGVINGNTQNALAMFKILKYDFENNALTFTSPYFERLIREIDANNAIVKTDKNGNIKYKIPGYTDVIKPSIATARNKRTAAVVRYLVAGIAQRGTAPDQRVKQSKKYKDTEKTTYSVSFKKIIYDIPIIEDSIIGKPATRRSDILKSIFGSNDKPVLLEYIDKYTLLNEKYINFNISVPVPSWSTIDSEITISHEGIRGEYVSPYPYLNNEK